MTWTIEPEFRYHHAEILAANAQFILSLSRRIEETRTPLCAQPR